MLRRRASFTINKILYNASGSFASTVPEFVSNNATIKYDDVGATKSFSGRVGTDDIVNLLWILTLPSLEGSIYPSTPPVAFRVLLFGPRTRYIF